MASLLSQCRCPLPGSLCHLRIHTRHYSSKPPNKTSTALPKPRLDYRAISENAVYKSHNAFNRKAPLPVGAIQSIERLYNQKKELSRVINAKRHAQSLLGDRIRQAGNDEEARQAALQHAKELKPIVSQLEHDLAQVDDELFSLASAVPNDTHPLTPLGPESTAVVLSTHGPDPIPHSPLRDHVSTTRQCGPACITDVPPLSNRPVLVLASRTRTHRDCRDTSRRHVREQGTSIKRPPAQNCRPRACVPRRSRCAWHRDPRVVPRAPIYEIGVVRCISGYPERGDDGRDATYAG